MTHARRRPMVVAHRGDSGAHPEHTAAAFRSAVAAGADVLEVDVVPCADGTLVARHEPALSHTTDVADRPGLASARSARPVDGTVVHDWWADRLPPDVVTGLRARERWPGLRRGSAAADDRWPVLTLAEVLALATEHARGRRRPVGVAVELKAVPVSTAGPSGGDPVDRLLADLDAAGVPTRDVPIWVMAFEHAPLDRLAAARAVRECPHVTLVQLVADRPEASAWDGIARRADVLAPDLQVLLPSAGAPAGPAIVAEAHRRRLGVWVWTLRAENAFLPPALRSGRNPAAFGRFERLVAEAHAVPVDAMVTDHPGMLRRLLAGRPAGPQ